jgi:hypothetical protein
MLDLFRVVVGLESIGFYYFDMLNEWMREVRGDGGLEE